jgi:16S rRNA (adenine(1408)-N(1))-methyltransferase
VLSAARRAPDQAFLGLDADASRMREASRRAARSPGKDGLANAWFAVAAAEAPPMELDGRVDELTVILPWGSLLRGVLGPEPWFTDAVRRLVRPAGTIRMLLSVTPRDGIGDIASLDGPTLDELAARWRGAGWVVCDVHPATRDDVARSGSSWAKRLDIPGRRAAASLRLLPPTGDPVETDQAPSLRRSTCAPSCS